MMREEGGKVVVSRWKVHSDVLQVHSFETVRRLHMQRRFLMPYTKRTAVFFDTQSTFLDLVDLESTLLLHESQQSAAVHLPCTILST